MLLVCRSHFCTRIPWEGNFKSLWCAVRDCYSASLDAFVDGRSISCRRCRFSMAFACVADVITLLSTLNDRLAVVSTRTEVGIHLKLAEV